MRPHELQPTRLLHPWDFLGKSTGVGRHCLLWPIPSRPALIVEEIIIRYTWVVLQEGMATHSSIFSWRIPWTEESGGLQSVGLQRVSHDWSDLVCTHTWVEIQLLPSYSLDDLGKSLHIKMLHTHSSMCVCVCVCVCVLEEGIFPHQQAIFFYTNWVSYSLPQFWCHVPGDSIRLYEVRTQS